MDLMIATLVSGETQNNRGLHLCLEAHREGGMFESVSTIQIALAWEGQVQSPWSSCSKILTKWVSFSIFVWNCEHSHDSVAFLAEMTIDLLSKEALTNKCHFQLVFETNLWNHSVVTSISMDGFPWWLHGKTSTCSARDTGLIPGWRRSPGEGNGNLLQYSCLGNPTDRGAWQVTVHGVTKKSDMI